MNYQLNESDIEVLSTCPVCDGDELRTVASASVGALEYLHTCCCRTCGLVFRDRRPGLDWFIENWAKRDETQTREKVTFVNEQIEEQRIQRYRSTARFLKEHPCGHRIVDIGCGTGTGLKAYEEEGFEAVGIEPDPSRARVGRERFGVHIVGTTVDDHELDPGSFDVATVVHSLEHFHYPHRIMQHIAGLVREGGMVYVEVPEFRAFVTDWNDAVFLAHLNNFSENNLMLLGARVGLRAIVRAFPQSRPGGEKHLGILFRREPGYAWNERDFIDPFVVRELEAHALQAYQEGLEDGAITKPVTFVLPEINDISLSYKATQVTDFSVEHNYHQRSARWDASRGAYVIGPPSERELDGREAPKKRKDIELSSVEAGTDYRVIPYQEIDSSLEQREPKTC